MLTFVIFYGYVHLQNKVNRNKIFYFYTPVSDAFLMKLTDIVIFSYLIVHTFIAIMFADFSTYLGCGVLVILETAFYTWCSYINIRNNNNSLAAFSQEFPH